MDYYPLAKPYIGKDEERGVLEVLRSGVLSIGPKQAAFEKAFAKFVGVKYACAVSSGTAGLHLALIAAGIEPGDEVITSPFSFVASANSILYVGARPVFADIDPVTYNLAPGEIEKKITKRTKAILVVHIFGQSAQMEEIMRIAKRRRLKIIEDACESVGAKYRGKMVGTFGESGVFAFYPNKQLTSGEGGMIVTNDRKKDALFRSLRNQGRAKNRQWLSHERLGYNYRLDEMSAALALAQLQRLPFLLRERRKIARRYTGFLSRFPALLQTPVALEGNRHSYFLYVVRLRKGDRDAVIRELEREGICARPYFPSIHLLPFYRAQFGFRRGNFPVSEAVSRNALALPFYVGLTKKDVQYISRTLVKTLSKHYSLS
ncbi:MAG: DegT/DnrJ/EryC1/StrS family aminotransferase [Patescibacteria group bacterium]